MLKFSVMLLCCMCNLRQFFCAPIIKASGVQWTEPKGNGKGNLTLMMIPQNNSCTNETDMLIAVKSDYQVVSQDTQLLNLVINEYQNDSLSESKCAENGTQPKEINPPNSVVREEQNSKISQGNGFNRNSISGGNVNMSSSADNIQKQLIKANQTENGVENFKKFQLNEFCSPNQNSTTIYQNNINEFDKLNCNSTSKEILSKTIAPKPVESVNIGFKSNLGMCKNKNNTGINLSLNTEKSQYNILNTSKDNSNERHDFHMNQADNGNSNNNAMITKQNIKGGESLSYSDFLKYLSSISEGEQHSDLDSIKISNNDNYYEVEKKNIPLQENKQSDVDSNGKSINDNNNVVNIFKFLSAAQARETTASVIKENTPDIFKFLKLTQPSLTTPASIRASSTVSILKLLNITNDALTSSNATSNKISDSNLFTDSEKNIFKFLNISEPNVGYKLKKINEGGVIDRTPYNAISKSSIVNEAVNIISKLKPDPHKGERNLRSDSSIGDHVGELAALQDGDFDIKPKVSKEDYLSSGTNEEILRKQLKLFNLNQVGESRVEENSNPTLNSVFQTTCYSLNVDNNNINGQKDIRFQTSSAMPLAGEQNTAIVISGEPGVTMAPNECKTNGQKNTNAYSQDTSFFPLGARENSIATFASREFEGTTVLPANVSSSHVSATISPTCRTSIIYICDPQKVTGAFEQISELVEEKISEMAEKLTTNTQSTMQGSLEKITLVPKINCSALLMSKLLFDSTTTAPVIEQNQNIHFEENRVNPLIESSLFLANKNEMHKGKSIPIFLNTSSDDMTDLVLSSNDEKVANFHANPSDLTINEETLEDIPPKIGITKNSQKKKVIIKSSNLGGNDQLFYPGQVLKMRFAGKNIIVEQMPSYRSEKFNKNCESTSGTEPPNEIEPDEDENGMITTGKTSKKPHPTPKVTNISEQYAIRGSKKQLDITSTTITTKKPDRTSKMKEISYSKSFLSTTTLTPTKHSEVKTQAKENESPTEAATEQESTENESTPISQAETSQASKTNKTEVESPPFVTVCKTVKVMKSTASSKDDILQDSPNDSCIKIKTNGKNASPTREKVQSVTKKMSIQTNGDKCRSKIESTVLKLNEEDSSTINSYFINDFVSKNNIEKSKCGKNFKKDEILLDTFEATEVTSRPNKITTKPCYDTNLATEEFEFSTSTKNPSQNKQHENNVKIPGESVKEIVIQIIRNTKKPESKLNTISCYNNKGEIPVDNDIQFQNYNIQRHPIFPVEKMTPEKMKQSGYEMEESDTENNQEQSIIWYPKVLEDENKRLNNDKCSNVYPYFQEENVLLENTDKNKEHTNQNAMPVYTNIQNAMINNKVIKGDDKYDKALPQSELKLITDSNNIINVAW